MLEYNVLDKLPESAGHSAGKFGRGKYNELFSVLQAEKDKKSKTVFINLKIIKKDQSYFKTQLRKVFGDYYDTLGDKYKKDVLYIRRNAYKEDK